jgi:hypothetical protein
MEGGIRRRAIVKYLHYTGEQTRVEIGLLGVRLAGEHADIEAAIAGIVCLGLICMVGKGAEGVANRFGGQKFTK